MRLSMEQRRNARAGETGYPRENPPTTGIVRCDSHLQKSASDPAGIEHGPPWWEASRLTTQPPWVALGVRSGADVLGSNLGRASKFFFILADPGERCYAFCVLLDFVFMPLQFVKCVFTFYFAFSMCPLYYVGSMCWVHAQKTKNRSTSILGYGDVFQKVGFFKLADIWRAVSGRDTLWDFSRHYSHHARLPLRRTGFSQVGIVPDNAVCQRIFSGISRFPRPFIPAPLHTFSITLIRFQDLAVKSRPNLFTSLIGRYVLQCTVQTIKATSCPSPMYRTLSLCRLTVPRYLATILVGQLLCGTYDKTSAVPRGEVSTLFPSYEQFVNKRRCGQWNLVHPMRMIEVNMERRRNEGAGETGDHRENPPTSGILWHDSHLRKSGVTRQGNEPGLHWWEASSLTTQHRGLCAISVITMIEVNMERRRNEEAGETGDPREDRPTNGIVRHDSHLRKSVMTGRDERHAQMQIEDCCSRHGSKDRQTPYEVLPRVIQVLGGPNTVPSGGEIC
ncbi:hypothetical protein PR048_018015 [Dryococelus australis]|uniref:Uncharacterized protein n=1 Tax=Dryococelus australis TaxID=614101 RepID=A0ABQ9HB29_9NEOP|nr:hypothetical protein PR048_018015 [Dryococelus australis]